MRAHVICLLLASSWALAQPQPPAVPEMATTSPSRQLAPSDTWPPPAFRQPRRASGHIFKSPQQVHLELQVGGQAMLLRNMCANSAFTDAQVERALAGLSRMTGREETCQSIRQY